MNRRSLPLPPGMTSADATTAAGFVIANVWRVFPDVTQFELNCAWEAPLGAPPGWAESEHAKLASSPMAGNAITTVVVLREARRERADLSEDKWLRLVGRLWPHLNVAQRLNPKEILAELDVTHPMPLRRRGLPADSANSAAPRRKPGPKLIVTREEVEKCRVALLAAGKPYGYEALARVLDVSTTTVRRRLRGN